MAGIPDALERRTILYSLDHVKAPNYEAYGEMYHEAGRLADAMECFERIADEGKKAAKLKQIRLDAIKAGNQFLLNRVDIVSDPLTQDEWLQTAQNAESLGKFMYALKSARRAENEALVTKLEQQLGIDRPALPEVEETNETPPPSEGGEAPDEASGE